MSLSLIVLQSRLITKLCLVDWSQPKQFPIFPLLDYKPLQCYECNSETECANAKLQKCPDDDNYRCFKLTTEVSYKEANVEVKTFSKGCIRKEQCDPIKRNVFYGTCPNDENCHMSCCEGGMCNVGTNAVVSALAMITCAAFAIFGN